MLSSLVILATSGFIFPYKDYVTLIPKISHSKLNSFSLCLSNLNHDDVTVNTLEHERLVLLHGLGQGLRLVCEALLYQTSKSRVLPNTSKIGPENVWNIKCLIFYVNTKNCFFSKYISFKRFNARLVVFLKITFKRLIHLIHCWKIISSTKKES